MKIVNQNNYLTFTIISTLLWAVLPIYAIEMKLININYFTLLYSLVFVNMFILGIISLKNKNKIKKKFKKEHTKLFVQLFVTGAISFIGYRFIYYYGIQNLNPIVINTLNYSWVYFVLLISIFMNKKDKLDVYTTAVFLVGLIGIAFTFGLFDSNSKFHYYYLLMVFGAFLTALDVNIIVKIKEKIIDDIFFIYFIYFVFLTILLTLTFLIMKIPLVPYEAMDFTNMIYIILFAFLFFIPKIIWISSYLEGNRVIISFFGYFIPVLSNVVMVMFYGFIFTNDLLLGFFIILISGILLNKYIKEKILNYLLFIRKAVKNNLKSNEHKST